MHVRGLPVFVWSVDGGGDGGEPPASPEPKEGSGDPADLGDAGKRAIAAERAARTEAEKRATAAEAEVEKYRKATEAEVEKYREATETEAERQARELDDAKKNAEQAAGLVARYEAAETAGLPLSMAKRLIGATPEELAADAAQLAQTLAAQPSGTPRADPSQGAGNTGSGRTTSVAEAMAELKASREKK